jgi:hypothetical protein
MRGLLLLLCVAAGSAISEPSWNPDISLVRVPNGGIQPETVMDRSGTLHLLYYSGDPAGGNLYYVKSSDAGRTWSAPLHVNSEAATAIAAGTIRGGQIAVGRNGRIHVAWNRRRRSREDRLVRNRENREHRCSIVASMMRAPLLSRNAI